MSVKPGVPPTLVVIAGGRGRRLGGVPKGLIQLESGLTIVEHLLSLGEGPRFINTNDPEAYERFGVPLIGDLVPEKGAPGGVVTALAIAPSEWVFVVACDMPLVTREDLALLAAARRPGADTICFTREGRLEPLVGLYRQALWQDWAPRLEGNPSLRSLLESTHLETIESPQPHHLISLNSLDDVREAAESFRRSGASATFQGSPW
ncbi:MAG: molybdenum cofactor guanylyltransferase [Myxococcota bacterium]